MGFDFIVIVPFLPSHCGFSFVFGNGVSFLVSSSVFLSMIVQQLVVIPVLSQEGDILVHSAPLLTEKVSMPVLLFFTSDFVENKYVCVSLVILDYSLYVFILQNNLKFLFRSLTILNGQLKIMEGLFKIIWNKNKWQGLPWWSSG